jgi:hypothetical protein
MVTLSVAKPEDAERAALYGTSLTVSSVVFTLSPMNPEQVADILLDSQGYPREAARRIIEWLLSYTKARSVSLWRDGESPALVLGCGIDQGTIATVDALWPERSDRPAMGDRIMMLPVRGGDAYLLLEGVDTKRIDVNTAASMGAVASKAMARTDLDGREARSPENGRRDELLASLTLHEWNIARVARAQGVTRKTIYEWMAKYAIRRERVVRS